MKSTENKRTGRGFNGCKIDPTYFIVGRLTEGKSVTPKPSKSLSAIESNITYLFSSYTIRIKFPESQCTIRALKKTREIMPQKRE